MEVTNREDPQQRVRTKFADDEETGKYMGPR